MTPFNEASLRTIEKTHHVRDGLACVVFAAMVLLVAAGVHNILGA